MRKLHITDNLGDLGNRVCTEEIRLLLGVAPLLLPEMAEDDEDGDLLVSEVKAIEDERFARLAKAQKNEMADEPGFAGEPSAEPAT